jgi:cysteine desulfurase
MNDVIYLDHNASAPLLAEVAEAIRQTWFTVGGNPASQHRLGQQARRTLESSREQIIELLGGQSTGLRPDRLVFTSGGTEANNLLLLGMLALHPTGHLVTSAIEHPSLLEPAAELERQGWQVTRVGANRQGLIQVSEIAAALRPETRLVSIMAANNETGVLQPLSEIGALCASRRIPLHSDASQLAGRLPVHFRRWNLTALTLSAHKFHGPVGIGGLVMRGEFPLRPLHFGGHQQGGLRPGTEPVALAVGMKVALELARERAGHLLSLQEGFFGQLTQAIPDLVAIGREAPRLPNTACLAFPGLERQALFVALD